MSTQSPPPTMSVSGTSLGPPGGKQPSRDRTRALVWAAAAAAGIWTSVVLISLFAPDNVSGAQHEHVPLAAILTWIWGVMATRTLADTLIRERGGPRIAATARALALAIIPIWGAAAAVGVFGPELVTGTDPTRFPISAVIAPIVALILTRMACQLLTAFKDGATRDDTPGNSEQTRR